MNIPVLEGANVITHSRMSSFRQCRRKHFYTYELGWRPERTPHYFRFGSAIHAGLDAMMRDEAFVIIDEEARRAYGPIDDANAHDWSKVSELLVGYSLAYAEDDSIAAVICSEQSFELPIRNPATGFPSPKMRVAGKIDKIVRLADGRLAVMEHKTTGDPIDSGSDYWTRLELDQQISLYYLAAQALGHDVQTVIYDVIRKPSIAPSQIPELDSEGCKTVYDEATGERIYLDSGKPRQSADKAKGWKLLTRTETPEEYGARLAADIAERPEFYFQRREIPRLQADLDDFAAELWDQQKDIAACRLNGRWYRNTAECTRMGSCEYLGICRNAADPREIPSGFRQATAAHEEL